MTKSITIRHVPEEARNALAARAAQRGQSLQEFLKDALIALAQRPDNRIVMAEVQARKRVTNTVIPAERILALRDSDRR